MSSSLPTINTTNINDNIALSDVILSKLYITNGSITNITSIINIIILLMLLILLVLSKNNHL